MLRTAERVEICFKMHIKPDPATYKSNATTDSSILLHSLLIAEDMAYAKMTSASSPAASAASNSQLGRLHGLHGFRNNITSLSAIFIDNTPANHPAVERGFTYLCSICS
uniref:Uncharacterized protein n=1 Tax=Tanacetum cinerariifolium TaxID=118510 RepID=A0A699IRP5_TANCI|nr:hypothetical protein [Tanacetum cinerariifolium]